MRQLKYDDEFNEIVEDIEIYTDSTIPSFIHDYIDNLFLDKVIFDRKSSKYYCVNCYSELHNHYCKNCNKKYSYEYYNVIYVDDIYDDVSSDNEFIYYFFDVKSIEPILYEIKEIIYLYRTTHITMIRKIIVNKAYLITSNYMLNLFTKEMYNYKECQEELNKLSLEIEEIGEEELGDINNDIIDFYYNYGSFLYTDNLLDLKNTVYKYTHIWEASEYLMKGNLCLADIVILPLTNQYFEYLVKHKLFNLAFSSDAIKDNLNIKDIRKMVRKYLNFMVDNNINYSELMLLNYTNIDDIDFLHKYANYYYIIKDICENKIDIVKVIDYFNKKKYKLDNLFEYNDYINTCKKLGFSLKDKEVLFPRSLNREHNKVIKEYQVIKDPEINKKIKKISNILSVNKYEDDNYVIYPAPDMDSMIEEGSMQNNCLRTYCEDYADGKTNIYYMRDKSRLNKSLVTIEVRNNKVVQARIKNNELPGNNLMEVIKLWERTLIPIDFSK